MFKMLEYKFKKVILSVILLSLTLVLLISYIPMRNIIIDNYLQLSNQSTGQQFQSVKLYMKLIEESSKLVTENSEALTALETPFYNIEVSPVLDRLRIANTNILGVTLYAKNGVSYTSSNISSNPTLDQLETNDLFRSFINSNQAFMWIVRYEDLSQFYLDPSYNTKKNGLFSLAVKIIKDNQFLGYVVVDTDMVPLYNLFRNKDYKYIENINTYMCTKERVLNAPYNSITNLDYSHIIFSNKTPEGGYTLTENKEGLLSYYTVPNSNSTIVILVPLKHIWDQLLIIKAVLISLALLFFILALLISNLILKSITIPLESLKNKMENPI